MSEPRRLAGADLTLVVPGSLAERWDVAIAAQSEGTQTRAVLAALGLCWPRFRRRKPYGGNVLAYGGLVADVLLAEGAPMGEILAAGNEAYVLCIAGLVPVEGAGDFSEPPADPDGASSGGA